MRFRVLLAAAGLLTASASVYGQAKLAGKWQTETYAAAIEAQKNAPAPAEGAAKGGGGGRGGVQPILLDLQVDGSGKISGMVTEVGNGAPLTIESGMITGKSITFVTQPRGVTWNLEMTDDDTLSLTGRVFAARGGAPGGGAPGGGGGAPGGGAPGGGAPGGGGGGAPGGGAPGGRAGGGRAAQQPIVLHRVK